MTRYLLPLALLVAGCASIETPDRPADLPASFVAPVPIDAAWPRTIEFLSVVGYAIEHSDRAGGIVRTDWLKMPAEHADRMLCGTNALGNRLTIRGEHSGWSRVHIMMTPAADGTTTAVIRPDYQIWWGVTNPKDPRDFNALAECQTTGLLERALVEAMSRP